MPPPEDQQQRLAALGRELDRLGRRVAAGEALDRVLAGEIEVLHTAPKPDPGPADDEAAEGKPALLCWLTAADDPAAGHAAFAELLDWLAVVYVRYSDGALPSCWAWHPDVVEELHWLRHAWCDAYQGRGACSARVGDWHDRQRPGVVRRIRAATGMCGLDRHTGAAGALTRRVPLAASSALVAAAWLTPGAWPLAPTDEQLAEAEAHDHQHSQLHR